MPKKPVYATDTELSDARHSLEASIQGVKDAGDKATRDLKAELTRELDKVSKTLTTNAGVTKEAIERVSQDAKLYADSRAEAIKKEILPLLPPLEDKIEVAQRAVEQQLAKVDADLRKLFANELMALTQQLDKELNALRDELLDNAEKWAREAAEALVGQRREIDASIEKMRQEAAANTKEARAAAEREIKAVVSIQEKVDLRQDERNERANRDILDKLARVDELIKETREGAREHIVEVAEKASAAVEELRVDASRRLDELDDQTVKLHSAVHEVENIPTRRVDWVIRNVSRRLRPPSASKACLHSSWFSPKFDMAGAHGLQLELQVFRPCDPPVEGEAAGDCAAFLWACRGVNLVYKLYVGNKSQQMEKLFNGRVPYGTKRFCFLKDQVNKEEDSLRVSVEILETVREVDYPISGPAPAPVEGSAVDPDDEATKPLEGKVVYRRHINNRLMEQVKSQVETMRSRMVRRVEWRLEQASWLRRCFAPGDPMCSVSFAAAGVEGLQLLFYPCGYGGATDGFCSLFLYAPAGASLRYTLTAGSHRREATNFFEDPGAFGRTNFCRFESIVEEDTDTILISLEIDEAHQDLVSKVAHPTVQPGDRRTQGQIDAAVPTAVESVVKMCRSSKKPPAGLEEKRVLPSLWTAKSLSDKDGPNDGLHTFEELRQPKGGAGATASAPAGKRTQPPSPAGSPSPLSLSRSMPSLGKDVSGNDLAALPKLAQTGSDWGSGRSDARKARNATKKGLSGVVAAPAVS